MDMWCRYWSVDESLLICIKGDGLLGGFSGPEVRLWETPAFTHEAMNDNVLYHSAFFG
jgi:hypothetical protein